MCLAYCRISPSNGEKLLEQPALIHRFLDPDGEVEIKPTGGFWKKLCGSGPAPEPPTPARLTLDPRSDDDEGDADKAWQAIHYLLTGDAEGGEFPEGFIVSGGSSVGNEEVGYGPARLIAAEDVNAVAEVLNKHSEETLRAAFDGPAMDRANVYPEIWERDGEDGFDYIWENFETMRSFIQETARREQALLIFLT